MRLGVIGCGNMGAVILKAAVANKIFKASDVFIADKNKAALKKIKSEYKAVNLTDNRTVVEKADFLLLAVKPQDLQSLLEEIAEYVNTKKTIIISICAGVKISFIRRMLGRTSKVVRVMPNLPALINNGASAVCFSGTVSAGQKKTVLGMFEGCGDVCEVKEKDMDAVTALSGSGPAYFFYFIDALSKAGVDMGLKKGLAKKLALSTAIGASLMAECSDEEMETLIARVTSKGGTTEAAFKAFKAAKLDSAFSKGVKAAKKRSEELSVRFK